MKRKLNVVTRDKFNTTKAALIETYHDDPLSKAITLSFVYGHTSIGLSEELLNINIRKTNLFAEYKDNRPALEERLGYSANEVQAVFLQLLGVSSEINQ